MELTVPRKIMTYQHLLNLLSWLTPDQLKDDVTVYDEVSDEFFAVKDSKTEETDDVLHKGHFFLTFKEKHD